MTLQDTQMKKNTVAQNQMKYLDPFSSKVFQFVFKLSLKGKN